MLLTGPEGSDLFCNRVARTVGIGAEGDSDQGVHQTDTDRQFACLITCSDKQTVFKLLLKQTRHILFCLQTVCKHWLGIGISRCLVQCLTQTLTLSDQHQTLVTCISQVCDLRGERHCRHHR
jgi:hypothetical protein